MNAIKIKANAKINIGLNIVEKRNDGFHNLETIFFPVYALFDEIEFRKSESFTLRGDVDKISSEDNLIYKAVALLEETTNNKFNVEIQLRKNIPIGAGLGGGSSDAAFTLIAMNKLFDLNIENDKLSALALELGSDVPFFLLNKPALAYSRGEILKEIPLDFSNYKLIIVNPGIHISTKEAFSNISPTAPEMKIEDTIELEGNMLHNFKKYIVNDFENYVFDKYPVIKKIKEILYNKGAEFASMSGTGSTVYGIFDKSSNTGNLIKLFPEKYLFREIRF